MDNQSLKESAQSFVQKNNDLLTEKKYYEFAQKIKLLGHRRFQGKKMDQAAALFVAGADTLYSIAEVQKNIPFELLDQLVEVYALEPKLLTKQAQQQFLAIINKRPLTSSELKLIHKLIIKTGKPSAHLTLSNLYIDNNITAGTFGAVERMVANLDEQRALSFVEQWAKSERVTKQEVSALWCRMALYRGLQHGVDAAQELFRKAFADHKNDSPYTVFTGFLLKTVLLNSKNAYETIERSYEQFLDTDQVFSGLFNAYGVKFFNLQKKKGGIMSLMQ